MRAVLERQLGAEVWVVHRLDRETSGVLLFARTPELHRELCLAFEQRRVRKTYIAFTLGTPVPREGRIETPLHPARRGKVRPALPGEDGAWDAATRYIVRKRWERDGAAVAMVETHPETGRHHQIRAHLRSIGTPILFDRVYGPAAGAAQVAGSPAQRLALHASRLAVPGAEAAGTPAHVRGAAPGRPHGAAPLARRGVDGGGGPYFFAWLISAWSSREYNASASAKSFAYCSSLSF